MPDELTRDLRQAARALLRQPGFAAAVVGTFALAIGTNAAMLGLITRLMLAPPPGIEDPARVFRLRVDATSAGGERHRMSTFSYPRYQAIRTADRAFAAVAAVRHDTVMVGRGATLHPASVVQASGDYFRVLAAAPERGRFFGPSDDELPRGASVVVLSHSYWTRHTGRDPGVVGTQMVLDGEPFTVIGVAARRFNGDNLAPVDLFVPLAAGERGSGPGWWSNEHINLVSIIARLAPGVAPEAASGVATSVIRAGDRSRGNGSVSTALLESVVPGSASRESAQSRIALGLSAVSLIVLMIATANVGTLVLQRAARRRRETAVRIALGASRSQLGRTLVMESVMLALVGAAAGLLLSRWLGDVVRVTLLPNLAPADGFIDRRVLIASVAIAGVSGILAGLSPMARAGVLDLSNELRAGGEHGSSSRRGFQGALVGVQVALCTVLLIGAGLFVRSLERIQSQDLGFSRARLLHVSLDFQGFAGGAERDEAHHDAVRRLRGVPGVTRATVVQAMPFGNFHVPPISIPGHADMPTLDGQPPFLYGATADYLRMMHVTARQGRLLTDADARGPLVVLVNESMARTLWPGQSAIGKCVRAGHGAEPPDADGNPAAGLPCREVVGVVRDSRARSLRPVGNEARQMQYYVPFEQLPGPPAFAVADPSRVSGLLVEVAGEPDRAAPVIQRVIQSGSSTPLYARVRPYQALIDPQLRSWRLGASLFSTFGALALGITAVGLFGVISYLVTQRARELGVRSALGATSAALWRMVVGDALRLVAGGVTAGAVIAMAAGPLVRDMLFQTSPWEPANLMTATGVLLVVTVVAASVPAWRAGRVDPLDSLRSDG